MTISTQTRTVLYDGNGVATVFAYPFKISASTDLKVYLHNVATGGFDLQTLTTHYSVSGAGNPGGGNITFVTAPASGVQNVSIVRKTDITQLVDYVTNDDFPAEVHEGALDKLTAIAQDQQDQLARALRLPDTDPAPGAGWQLPAKDSMKGRVLAFDPTTGDPAKGPLITSVDTVTANVGAVDTVAANIVSVNTVADAVPDFDAVLANEANINTVAASVSEVATVSTNIASVQNASANMPAIISAPANAQAAAVSQLSASNSATAAASARDAALIQAGVYVDEPTGRAAVANGVAFKVQGSGSVAAYEYRRVDASSSTLIATYPAKGYVDNLAASLGDIPQSVKPNQRVAGPINKTHRWGAPDVEGRIRELGFATEDGLTWNGVVSGSSLSGDFVDFDKSKFYTYRTLFEGSYFKVTPSGQIVERMVANTDAVAEVVASRGSRAVLNDRLSVATDAYGNLFAPGWGLYRLRQTSMKIRNLIAGVSSTQFAVAFIGDSWSYNTSFIDPITRHLRSLVGDAGGGYVNNLNDIPVRPFAVVGDFLASRTGSWNRVFSKSVMPDLGFTYTTEVGAKLTFSAGSTAAEVDTASLIHYSAVGADATLGISGGDGVVRYRWNSGAWVVLTLTASAPGEAASVALSGVPTATPWTLEIEHVSGETRIGGLDARSTASGIRVHKLGQDGSAAMSWATRDEAKWIAAIQLLGPIDLFIILLSTNDQPSRTPASVAADIHTIASRAKVANPASDVLIVQPPENHLGRTTQMADITAAVRAMCVTQKLPFLDLQYFFGDATTEYALGGVHDWLPDGVHPSTSGGGPLVAEAIIRALTTSL